MAQTGSGSKPVEMGALWSETGPAAKQGGQTHQRAALEGGHFFIGSATPAHALASGGARAAMVAGSLTGALQGRAALMRRFLSFRDFDWTLLGLLLLLCAISVLEVHSATLHTRFSNFGVRQILLDRGRRGRHVHLRENRLSPDTGLGTLGVWLRHSGFGRGAVAPRSQGAGRTPMDQVRPLARAAFRIRKAGAGSDGGALFCQPGRPEPFLEGDFQGFRACGCSYAVCYQAA